MDTNMNPPPAIDIFLITPSTRAFQLPGVPPNVLSRLRFIIILERIGTSFLFRERPLNGVGRVRT